MSLPVPRSFLPALAAGLALGFALLAGGCASPANGPDRSQPVSAATRAADETLDRWIAALGGADAINQLMTFESRGRLTFGEGQAAVRIHALATNRRQFRIETELPNGTYVQASDGSSAWQQHSALGYGLLPAADWQARLGLTDLQGPLMVKAAYATRFALPDEVIDGHPLKVLMMRRLGQAVEKWYFDPETYRRVRVDYPDWPGGRSTRFSDYRAIGGTRFLEAFHVVDVIGGQRSEVQLDEITGNVTIPLDRFTAPRAAVKAHDEIIRLIVRYSDFSGGRATNKIMTRVTEEEGLVPSTGLRTLTKTYIKRPNRILVEETSPGLGTSWQGFDGKTGWAWSEVEGYREIKDAELMQLVGRASLDGSQLLGTIAPLTDLLPARTEGNRTIVGVRFAIPAGEVGEIDFDPKTGEMVRTISVVQAGPTGQVKVTSELSDYRWVDGVRLPFRTVLISAAIRSEVTVKSIKQNIPVEDALFKPRRE